MLQPEGVRQDHLALARTVDDKGGVTGAGALRLSKIGGPVDGAMLLIPDPMGATGSTISKVIEQYGAETYGRPAQDHRRAPHHHARVPAARDDASTPR